MIIHADEVLNRNQQDQRKTGEEREAKRKARIETFVVGHDISKGEKLQWIVEGGKYKASFLLPDDEGDPEGRTEGLLISEVSRLSYPSFCFFCLFDYLRIFWVG